MQISLYSPNLTSAELNRFHLTASDACLLGGVGTYSDSALAESRKRLSNISSRDGLVPFEKSGTAKTSPNLYSVKSAMIFRCIDDLTGHAGSQRTYSYAAEVAHAVGDLAENLVEQFADVNDLSNLEWFIAYGSYGGKAEPRIIRPGKFSAENIIRGSDTGIYNAGDLIWQILRAYPDYWHDNRLSEGLERADRYRGSDTQGKPLDPNHPWNRDLPPLERAKRLLEIEEHIAALEAKRNESPPDS